MSEIVVTASKGAMNHLLAKLATLMGDEYKKLKGVRKEIVFLNNELSAMNALLEELADRDELDPLSTDWRNHIREMAYDIEDCIDDFMRQVASNRKGTKGGFHQKIARRLNKLRARHQIANQIQDIKARVVEASKRRKRYMLNDDRVSSSHVKPIDPRLSALYKETASLVGIDGPKEKLTKWLMGDEQERKVVSVVGLGGLGKTTLVKEVYRDIGGKFDCKAFVSVTQRPDMTVLLNSIISQIGQLKSSHSCSVEDLIDSLREYLQHKRYFVVIDDLWDPLTWEILSCAFPQNKQRSRVVVTTRNVTVAVACCCLDDCIFNMKPLNLQDSRRLFLNRIFGSQEDCPSQFEEVSEEILKRCGGLPLAILTISSLLASNRTRLKEEWEYIRNSLGSQFATNPTLEGMRQILDLSYKHLPHHLRACLLYLGMYPEDYVFMKSDLVRQWVAEGFVSNLQGLSAMDVGESFFNELINRSMVQPEWTGYNGNVLSCRVHDMMLDLIIKRCREDNFACVTYNSHDTTGPDRCHKVRRLSLNFCGAKDGEIPGSIDSLKQVRSLVVFRKTVYIPPLSKFRFLRVLVLIFFVDCINFEEGQEWSQMTAAKVDLTSISQLFQLRYLRIQSQRQHLQSSTYYIKMPSQIRGLQHLETMIISWGSVNRIPSNIFHLPCLSYLKLPPHTRLPDEIGNAKSLCTLQYFDILNNSLENIEGLGELTDVLQFHQRMNLGWMARG
uniref:AAA+ ATPase domain-containing protein n=1 Tax=Leersia perrieri TaxID=77586 RepID=A0A0D9X3J6_9ORYZ